MNLVFKLNFYTSTLKANVGVISPSSPQADTCRSIFSFYLTNSRFLLPLTNNSEVDLASLKSAWSSTRPRGSAPSSLNRGQARRTTLNVRLTSWMLFIILVSSDCKTRLTNQGRSFSSWSSKCHWIILYCSLAEYVYLRPVLMSLLALYLLRTLFSVIMIDRCSYQN